MKKAELNLIDKAVAFLNPQGAVNRMIARQKLVNFSYDAVKYNRERKGPSSLSGAEDYRSNYDRVELMKRARDLAENVGLVRSILMKFASHTAANISYQARTETPEVNTDVEAYWSSWWDKCDITTRHTGSTMMQVAMMSMLRDGDFLFVLVRDKDGNLKIQGIEADRLGDPFRTYTSLDLIGGIHIDRDSGAPSAYDIFSRSIGDFYTYQATIPATQAFHLFDPLRIDQYRGISAFHTAINDATDIYDIINFEKMAAKNASAQAGIIKRNNNNASDLSSLTNDENVNGDTIKLEAIESGKISYLEPGEDIIFPDGPSRPSGAFAEFHKILLRNICLGLGIPYSFAVDPSAMSGPTARLEMQQAGRTFRRYQKLLDDKVLRPIKNIVIADAVSRGLIDNNVGTRTTKGIFNFGANVSIDLGRESASAISEFKTGLRTAADIYAERGQDFESAMRQRAIEAKLVKDLADEYDVTPDTISDIALEGIKQAAQAKPTQQSEGAPKGQTGEEDNLGTASLNGAQVSSLINVINAVAVGAVSKEGAVSIITSAFPTISADQARAIVQGINIGTPIPTTKDEKKEVAKDQGEDASGGPAPQEPTPPPPAPAGTAQKKSSLEVLESLDPASVKMLIEGMMGGIELAKYDGIDFTPPEGAREAAKRSLDVRETKPPSQRGMTPVGLARARDLINGVKMSPDTVRRMKAFFDRHEVDKKGATFGEQGKGWQAWNGWGGDAGFSWATKIVRQMDARDNKELAECPLATQDIKTNLANRAKAVEDADYGPANPNEPNEDYWKAKADEFQGDIPTAKKMLCGNCAAFNLKTDILDCIEKGIGSGAEEVKEAGQLGYCEIFDFKCASRRTCSAWVVGGPITDEEKELAVGDCGQEDIGTFGPNNVCAVGYGRPPLKGGYEPKRPGGQFPKDYKRPTPQGKKETPKEEDQTASKRQDIQEVTKQEHLKAIKDSYKNGDGYEKEKLEIGEPEKGLVDDYRILSGGIWSKYERNLSSGMSQEKAFEDAINDSGNFPEDALNYATGSTLNKEDIKSIKDNLLKKNDGALKEYFNKSRQIAESKISELNKLTNTPFSKEQTLYRGFRANNKQGKGFLEQVKKGGEIDFDSFMSTSSDPEVARRYARRETGATPKGESVLFKFKAKRGISTINSNDQERESNFKEVVLPKGKYKVASRKSIKTGDAITHFIEMEQI